jgi:NAD(P)H dehydrogenase (quinone)
MHHNNARRSVAFHLNEQIMPSWGGPRLEIIGSTARADYAEADATVLTAENQAGKIYELAADSAYPLEYLAAEIARQSGKNIGYVNLPETEHKNILVHVGLPEVVAVLLSDSDIGASKTALFGDSHQLSKLNGRSKTPLATAVAAALQ